MYNTYIGARTCCNAANPSCCNSQLMGGGRMLAIIALHPNFLVKIHTHKGATWNRALELGQSFALIRMCLPSFWSRICTYLRACRQLSIFCPTVIFLDKRKSQGEKGKKRRGQGRSRQNHRIHLGSKGLSQEQDRGVLSALIA